MRGYKTIVTMLCFICGRRKAAKLRAGSYFGASLGRIKNDYPHISVEGLNEDDNLTTARCPWCRNNGFEEPADKMLAHAEKLVEDAARLRELIAARKKREAKKALTTKEGVPKQKGARTPLLRDRLFILHQPINEGARPDRKAGSPRRNQMTRYRIPLTDFEWRVALDALSSFGGSDPFGSDGDTMISDSDYRGGLESFCAGLRESSRYYDHDLEGREDFETPEEADQYADALARVADKIEAAVDAADEAAEKEAKEAEFQEWYEAELEREEELREQAGECPDTVN